MDMNIDSIFEIVDLNVLFFIYNIGYVEMYISLL